MTVEHRVLKSAKPERKGDYSNCIYACRLCNQARGKKPVDGEDAMLLDPTQHAWAYHFSYSEAKLQPRPGDTDAVYTHTTYDLDTESKVTRREARRSLIEDRLRLVRDFGTELTDLLALAEELRSADDPAFFELWQEIRDLREQVTRAKRDLENYRIIPPDAPDSCRCSLPGVRSLPSWLESQAQLVD